MRPNLLKSLLIFGTAICLASASGCNKKEDSEEAKVEEARLELRSDFLASGDSLRWIGFMEGAPQDTARAWLMLGVLYLSNNRPQIAIEYFKLSEKYDPERSITQLNMADAYNRMRQYDLATERFKAFLQRNPQSQLSPEIFRIIQKYRSIESEKLIPSDMR